MTSFAFIMGVVPLMLATGAGAEVRQVMGFTVFAGMLGVTIFGLIFTPVFYVFIRQVLQGGAALPNHDGDVSVNISDADANDTGVRHA